MLYKWSAASFVLRRLCVLLEVSDMNEVSKKVRVLCYRPELLTCKAAILLPCSFMKSADHGGRVV
jgi:hypothetical protein